MAPSQFYPTQGNVWFPNNGYDGYGDISFMTTDLKDQWGNFIGPWKYASVGAVVGSAMNQLYPNEFDNIQAYDWGWGVFYAKDSNAGDQRCEWWDSHQGWDCPGGWIPLAGGWEAGGHEGSGNYPPGNPNNHPENGGGGGAGCHYGHQDIDQPDSSGSENLVGNSNCECNYNLSGNDWHDWVWAFINSVKQKSNYASSRPWLGGTGNLAPGWAMDASICWVSNPRDLIKMQNALYYLKTSWNNQRVPQSNWDSGNMDDLRKYWGWNEIPVNTDIVENPDNWDAVMIKLPTAICEDHHDYGLTDSAKCLGQAEMKALESDLDGFVNAKKLIPGAQNVGFRPGSYIVFAREWGQTWDSTTSKGELGSGWSGINFQRWFYCESIIIGKYETVHMPPSADPNGQGACYIQYSGGPSPTPPPTPTPAPVPSSGSGAIIHSDSQKCLGTENSDISVGKAVVFVKCDSSDAQSWNSDGETLSLRSDSTKCIDSGAVSTGAALFLWDCNGMDQQSFGIDPGMGTIYAKMSSDASLCMDVQNDGQDNVNVAWLWDCNLLPNQHFDWLQSMVHSDIVA